MCDFCEGKEQREIHNHNGIQSIAYVDENKYLVVKDGDKEYKYDLCFCPECGKRLRYNSWERVYVTNITKDEVIKLDDPDAEYEKNPLHTLICDKRFEDSDYIDEQVGFIITESQLREVKDKGYCDILCTVTPNG